MPIATATINKANIYVKHSSGAIVTPSAVTDLGGGNYQYAIVRDWQQTDSGTWEIWSSENFAVMDAAGNRVEPQKIGEFTIAVSGPSNHLIMVPWDSITRKLYQVRTTTPDLDNPDWQIWHQLTKDPIAWTYDSRITFRAADGLAIEHLARTGPLPATAEADSAIALGGNAFQNVLPGGATITYSPTRSVYTHTFTFPSGVYNAIAWKAFTDAAGLVELNGWNGSSAIPLGETSRSQGIQALPPSAMAIRFYLTRTTGAIVEYLVPLNG